MGLHCPTPHRMIQEAAGDGILVFRLVPGGASTNQVSPARTGVAGEPPALKKVFGFSPVAGRATVFFAKAGKNQEHEPV